VRIEALIRRLQDAVNALRGDGIPEIGVVSFKALPPNGQKAEQVEIVSSAFRQIETMKKGLIGAKSAPIPYSERYLKWRIKKGLGATPTWTLVRTGLLYRSMGYYVKGGELYVTYDKNRRAAVKYLSQRAGFHVLDVSRVNLIEMAARIQARRLQNFIDILRRGYGTR
jgi:hypothetical protein